MIDSIELTNNAVWPTLDVNNEKEYKWSRKQTAVAHGRWCAHSIGLKRAYFNQWVFVGVFFLHDIAITAC